MQRRQVSIKELPKGDILIHCGDLLYESSAAEFDDSLRTIKDVDEWLGTFDFQHTLVIGGNHDTFLERLGTVASKELFHNATYLCDESWTSPEGLVVYGTPYSLANSAASPNKAFQEVRESKEAESAVAAIPECDILVTHGPAAGYGDDPGRGMIGCSYLASHVKRIRPLLHCCGHVHQAHSVSHKDGVTYANASVADILYCLRNPPVVFTFPIELLLSRSSSTRTRTAQQEAPG